MLKYDPLWYNQYFTSFYFYDLLNMVRAIPEKKTGGGGGVWRCFFFCTPPSVEFDFHRDHPPIDLETFEYQQPMEFN